MYIHISLQPLHQPIDTASTYIPTKLGRTNTFPIPELQPSGVDTATLCTGELVSFDSARLYMYKVMMII